MSARKTTPRWVDATIGLLFIGLIAAFTGLVVMMYQRSFDSTVDVSLATDTVGSAMNPGADVKLNGVPVGRVSSIETEDRGAVLTLALDPEAAGELSDQTTARLLPKTLFGERYVSLQAAGATGEGLQTGDSINQDTSKEAAELQRVLDELLPLLRSIQPEKLQASLTELATMLRGRGEEMGDVMADWGDYLTKLEPSLDTLATDMDRLAEVANSYADAAPDLLTALDSMTTTSQTLADNRALLTDIYQRVIASADNSTGWMTSNRRTVVVLSAESRRALEAAAPYSNQFGCLLRGFADFIQPMDRTLGAGTKAPGVRVVLNVSQPREAYRPGTDQPRWRTGGKPSCPYVPSSARPAAATPDSNEPDRIPAPKFDLLAASVASAGLGDVNSPGENRAIAELMAATTGEAVEDYPAWGSLLVGPVLRGTEVEVR